ncbi:hypothetical protein KSF78_0003586 [Schistosoma japonicum]|nr:hypothetical protein KSF78_0003586 [Schistosoma japonicum]
MIVHSILRLVHFTFLKNSTLCQCPDVVCRHSLSLFYHPFEIIHPNCAFRCPLSVIQSCFYCHLKLQSLLDHILRRVLNYYYLNGAWLHFLRVKGDSVLLQVYLFYIE